MQKRKKYIAYGSNLNLEQMAVRCPTAQVAGRGEIRDYELLFRGHRNAAGGTLGAACLSVCRKYPVNDIWGGCCNKYEVLFKYEAAGESSNVSCNHQSGSEVRQRKTIMGAA